MRTRLFTTAPVFAILLSLPPAAALAQATIKEMAKETGQEAGSETGQEAGQKTKSDSASENNRATIRSADKSADAKTAEPAKEDRSPSRQEPSSDATSAKVVQVFRDSKRASAQFPKNGQGLAVGMPAVISNSAGEACEGSIIALKGGRATAEFPNCSSFSDFRAGSTIAISDHEAPAPAAAPMMADPREEPRARPNRYTESEPRPRPRLRFGGKMFWDSGSSLRFDSAKAYDSTASYSGSVEYKMDSAAGIAAELMVSEERGWGFNGGLSYEAPRKLKSADVSLRSASGAGYTGSGVVQGDATLEIVAAYGNAIYRWRKWYLPFGLTIARPIFKNEPSALRDITLGFGIQVAGGYWINDHLALELGLRSLAISQKSETVSSGTVDLGAGSIPSLQFGIKGVL